MFQKPSPKIQCDDKWLQVVLGILLTGFSLDPETSTGRELRHGLFVREYYTLGKLWTQLGRVITLFPSFLNVGLDSQNPVFRKSPLYIVWKFCTAVFATHIDFRCYVGRHQFCFALNRPLNSSETPVWRYSPARTCWYIVCLKLNNDSVHGNKKNIKLFCHFTLTESSFFQQLCHLKNLTILLTTDRDHLIWKNKIKIRQII